MPPLGATDAIRDFLGPGSFTRNAIIGILVVVVLLIVLFFMFTSGYFIWAIIAAIFFVLILVAFFMYSQLTKYRLMDAMEQGFLQLYRSTLTFNMPIEVPLITAKSINSTIWGTMGYIAGRAALQADKDLLKYMLPEDKLNEENNHGLLWCVRVRPRSKELPKNVLCIFADSQVSAQSRDVTGDWECGKPILVYGSWLRFGKFFICLNENISLDHGVAAVTTSAVMAVLEKYVNRLSQLAVMDAKTKPQIVEAKALKKREAETVEQQ